QHTCAEPRRPLRADGATGRRKLRTFRRCLHPRLDPATGEADRRRVLQRHAAVCRAHQRAGSARAHRLPSLPRQHPARCASGKSPAMSTVTAEPALPETERNYLANGYSLWSWLTTTDHKRIAILYAVTITAFFFIGGAAATLMRLELISPTPLIMGAETYNKLFTAHGVIMVWFFLIPSIPATLGNFLIPMMVGAKDVALPRVNLLSWYTFILGGAFVIVALISGGIDTGWTFYIPLSTRYSETQVVYGVIGVFVTGFSSILTGLNFIVTVHRLRAPGLTWFKLPLFVWAIYATSIILVLATPVLAMTLVLLAVQRVFGLGIFDAALGGDPVLFQHMFWFYSHPAVYIMVLPAMGVASEVITCFARKPVFGYRTMAYAIAAIAAF